MGWIEIAWTLAPRPPIERKPTRQEAVLPEAVVVFYCVN
jgi:hypothetical protein